MKVLEYHDTALMPEIDLRNLQLTEIRAMLRLPRGAAHQDVIKRLLEIGKHDKRIDISATPERYAYLRKNQ